MKKKISLFLLSICALCASTFSLFAKSDSTTALNSIDGKWQEHSGQIVVQRVIKLNKGDKAATYDKMLNYLSSSYKKDANGVLKSECCGCDLLTGSGSMSFYVNEIATNANMLQSIPHALRAEVKSGRVRITLTADSVNWSTKGSTIKSNKGYTKARKGAYPLLDCKPSKNADNKNRRSDFVFYYAVTGLSELIDKIEQSLKESSAQTSSNW